MSKTPKGLLYDLETSYTLNLTFGQYPEAISHTNIVEDWHIHCASWKWLGEEKVYSAVEKNRDDKNICIPLHKAFCEADFVITHNGVKFDNKKLHTRIIAHGLDPLPTIPNVDTLKEARSIAAFSSNRLDYIGEYLGVGRKLHNSPNLWRKAFFGDKKALKEMLEYNKQDVLLLEEIYTELLPYMKNHPNFNSIMGTEDNCPKCGSSDLTKRGFSITRTGRKQRYQCANCWSWSESSKSDHITKVR